MAVPNNDGYITAVETAYAIQRNFPTASMKNASGDYTQPDPVNVASALAYATQNADGTHNLNFDGAGPHVYNPSTYSYLLTPTVGLEPGQGRGHCQFANYALTIGQQKATEIGYASLGLSLEQYGVNAMKQQVPGAVALTAQEQNSYACGDLTVPGGAGRPDIAHLWRPEHEQLHHPEPSCQRGAGALEHDHGRRQGPTASRSRTGPATTGSGATGTGVDPGVSLGTSPALATTGGNPLPIVLPGAAFVADRMVAPVGGYGPGCDERCNKACAVGGRGLWSVCSASTVASGVVRW